MSYAGKLSEDPFHVPICYNEALFKDTPTRAVLGKDLDTFVSATSKIIWTWHLFSLVYMVKNSISADVRQQIRNISFKLPLQFEESLLTQCVKKNEKKKIPQWNIYVYISKYICIYIYTYTHVFTFIWLLVNFFFYCWIFWHNCYRKR